MKTFIKLICVTLFCVTAFSAIKAETTNTTNQTIYKQKKDPFHIGRPLAPSNMRIYFSYDAQAGVCHFTLRPEIEYMSVEIENLDTHIMYFGEVDATDPVMYQSLDRGYYQITCTTDDGSIYGGEPTKSIISANLNLFNKSFTNQNNSVHLLQILRIVY